MAIIEDPDDLVLASSAANIGVDGNIFLHPDRKVELKEFGALTSDGVSAKALHSFFHKFWNNEPLQLSKPFPTISNPPANLDFVNGWTFFNDYTIKLMRTGGITVRNGDGSVAEIYSCIITPGSGIGIADTDQAYYQLGIDSAPVNFSRPGPVNELVKTFGDITHGDFDYRGFFNMFVREYGKEYGFFSAHGTGVTLAAQEHNMTLVTNRTDNKITVAEGDIAALGVTIDFDEQQGPKDVNGSNYMFVTVIDANGRTLEEVYSSVNYQLSLNADINESALATRIGQIQKDLLYWEGDTLVTSSGVYIKNYLPTDRNNIIFTDVTGTRRKFPYIAGGILGFDALLTQTGQGVYHLVTEASYLTDNPVLVQDADGVDIKGTIGGSEISFSYDYDSVGSDLAVRLIAIASGATLSTGSGVLSRSTTNRINVQSSTDYVFSDPS